MFLQKRYHQRICISFASICNGNQLLGNGHLVAKARLGALSATMALFALVLFGDFVLQTCTLCYNHASSVMIQQDKITNTVYAWWW